jgi:hypothetical protein
MIWLPQIFEIIAAGRQHRTVRLCARIPNSLVPPASGKLVGPLAGSTSGLGQSRRFGDVRVTSVFPLIADVRQRGRQVRKVPILLQNSFGIDQLKFSGPYVRRTNDDLRDYVIL